MTGRIDHTSQRSWRRIDAAYGEVAAMREFLGRIRGGWPTRLARRAGLLPPPPMEAAVLDEISFLEKDISRMRRAYAENLGREKQARA